MYAMLKPQPDKAQLSKLNTFQDASGSQNGSRNTSFFIDDILLNKPKPLLTSSRDLQAAMTAAAVAGIGAPIPRLPGPIPPEYAAHALAYLPGAAAALLPAAHGFSHPAAYPEKYGSSLLDPVTPR